MPLTVVWGIKSTNCKLNLFRNIIIYYDHYMVMVQTGPLYECIETCADPDGGGGSDPLEKSQSYRAHEKLLYWS